MASVRKREWTHNGQIKSAWVVSYNDASGKPRLKTYKSKKEADRGRLQIETELKEGTHLALAETVTFRAAAEEWLRDCERRNKAMGSPARSTIKSYESLLGTQVLPTFASEQMTDLKGEKVQDWLNEKASLHPYDTLRQLRLIVALIVKHCIKTGRLKRNVLTDQQVRIPGEKKRIVVPTGQQIQKLIAAMADRAKGEQILSFLQRRAFVGLALFGGMRAGEICGLAWDHVDLETSVIRIRHSYSYINGLKGPKTRAGIRDVPIVPIVHAALVELKAYCGVEASGFVFTTKAGENLRKSFDAIIWRPVMQKAGMTYPVPATQTMSTRRGRPYFHFHALRHAAVSLLIKEGVNGLHIASFVGHANVNTTMGIYGHLFPEDDAVRVSMGDVSKNFEGGWAPVKPSAHIIRPPRGRRARQGSDIAS